MKKDILKKHNRSWYIKILLVLLIAVQLIFLIIVGINTALDYISLNKYKDLYNKQISKVITDCNSAIANGISKNESSIKDWVEFSATIFKEDPVKEREAYLRLLSLSHCRASEFVLLGKNNIYNRTFSSGDYIFGTGEAPRAVSSETFKDLIDNNSKAKT